MEESTYDSLLEKVTLFAMLTKDQRNRMVQSLEEVTVVAKEMIINEGDEGTHFYIIVEGEVSITKIGVEGELARLTKGSVFGEKSLLSDAPTNASVHAAVPSKLMRIDRDSFQQLLMPGMTPPSSFKKPVEGAPGVEPAADAGELSEQNNEDHRKGTHLATGSVTGITGEQKRRVLAASMKQLQAASTRPTMKEELRNEEDMELAALREMLSRSSTRNSSSTRRDRAAWNASRFKATPYSLRGLVPMVGLSRNEPWSSNAIDAVKRLELPPSANYATATLSRLDDGMNDDTAMLRRRRMAEERAAAAALGRPEWDPRPLRYVPTQLAWAVPPTGTAGRSEQERAVAAVRRRRSPSAGARNLGKSCDVQSAPAATSG